MLAIIADDLTGALDSAAPFAARGMRCEVAVGPSAIPTALRCLPDVLTICLSTRELTPEQAQETTVNAFSALPEGVMRFKKIDSRLKGHIAAELDVIPFKSALAAPAIPEFGRIVRSGCIEGFGIEAPISISDRMGSNVGRISIPDTVTQSDMYDALERALLGDADMLIGARGLAEALADMLTEGRRGKATDVPTGPALFVIGSRDPITLRQVEALLRACPLTYIEAPDGIVDPLVRPQHEITVVQATPGMRPRDPDEVSANLAKGVVPLLTERSTTLVLSGGATAEAVLKQMNVNHFQLVGECLPGLGLARTSRQTIITKSGGFGTPEILKNVAMKIVQKATKR